MMHCKCQAWCVPRLSDKSGGTACEAKLRRTSAFRKHDSHDVWVRNQWAPDLWALQNGAARFPPSPSYSQQKGNKCPFFAAIVSPSKGRATAKASTYNRASTSYLRGIDCPAWSRSRIKTKHKRIRTRTDLSDASLNVSAEGKKLLILARCFSWLQCLRSWFSLFNVKLHMQPNPPRLAKARKRCLIWREKGKLIKAHVYVQICI